MFFILLIKNVVSGRLNIFALSITLYFQISPRPAHLILWLFAQTLLLFLAHHECRPCHVFRLLVGEHLNEHQVHAEDEKTDYGENHEDDVGDEVAIGDGGCRFFLTGLWGECEGEDQDCRDKHPEDGVQFWLAGASAREAPDDGEDDCDYDDEGAGSNSHYSARGRRTALTGDDLQQKQEKIGVCSNHSNLQLCSLRIQINLNNKMQSGLGDILHQEQIKQLIGKIRQIDIKDYASAVWFKQDESLQRLNMQLHINALMKNDEYILEECVTQDKYKVLIYDLIMTATWKEKVLRRIRSLGQPPNSLKLYLAIYHESVICNILETFMFYRTAIDESGDFLIEVIDYCYKKISWQVAESIKRRKIERQQEYKLSKMTEEEKRQAKVSKILKRTPEQELNAQIQDIQFKIFIMCVSIIRYITDYLKHLEIGILHHLLIECNIFSVLVPLIQERPWLKTTEKGERQIFEDGKWSIVPKSQYGKLPKTEAQVWITIFNLYMSPECNKKYEVNDQRKNTLLRLRKYLNEVLLDQIPNLSHMLRSLQELSIMNVPTHLTTNPFVVQQIPIIATEISRGKNWQQIAKEHLQRLRQSLDESQKAHMMKLADLYTNNDIQGLTEGFKCGKCQKQAFKRCSKCKSVWYCSKQCQVGDWPNHKTLCNKKAKQLKEAQVAKQKQVVIPKKPTIDELD